MANDDIVDFEDEDGVDVAGAMQEAIRNVVRVEYDQTDLDFFFNQCEIKMGAAGVKKNYTKFQVLSEALPKKVIDEVKPLLRKKASDFPNKDAYKQLKKEVLRIFGPKPDAAIDRALSRTLTGLPSQLARAIAGDVCSRELDCPCCPAVVLSLWKRHLPGHVRAGISHYILTKNNFNEVLQRADDIFTSHAPSPSVAAVTATWTRRSQQSLTLSRKWQRPPEVVEVDAETAETVGVVVAEEAAAAAQGLAPQASPDILGPSTQTRKKKSKFA